MEMSEGSEEKKAPEKRDLSPGSKEPVPSTPSGTPSEHPHAGSTRANLPSATPLAAARSFVPSTPLALLPPPRPHLSLPPRPNFVGTPASSDDRRALKRKYWDSQRAAEEQEKSEARAGEDTSLAPPEEPRKRPREAGPTSEYQAEEDDTADSKKEPPSLSPVNHGPDPSGIAEEDIGEDNFP